MNFWQNMQSRERLFLGGAGAMLVLFLIFMSGFLRDEGKVQRLDFASQPLVSPLQSVSISQSTEQNAPVQIPQIARSRFASKEQAIWQALAQNPHASDEELAQLAQTTVRTANKWTSKIRSKAS